MILSVLWVLPAALIPGITVGCILLCLTDRGE